MLDNLNVSPGRRKRNDEDEVLDSALDAKPSDDLSSQTGYSARSENSLVNLQKSALKYPLNMLSQKASLMAYVKNKYLSLMDLLPNAVVTTELCKVFFEYANSHVGVLEEYFFYKALRLWKSLELGSEKDTKVETISRETLFFPAVLYQVLAVALQYVLVGDDVTRHLGLTERSELDALSQKWTHRGGEIMKLLGRQSPTITSVQHDLMRGFWLKNSSQGTASWYNLGDAIRQAQDLGLHLKSDVPQGKTVEETLENLWYEELRRRLWVSLFNWDAHMAMVLGRPRSINVADCNVEAPLDCDMPLSPPTTVPSSALTSQAPSLYTRHLFNNFISHKTHEMLSLGANRKYVKDYSVVKKLHLEVLQKLHDLPATARPNNTDYSWDSRILYLPRQREHILTFAYSFLVALHRPHAATHAESLQYAVDASLSVLESQDRLFQLVNSRFYGTFGLPFYSIDAALFLSTLLSSPDLNAETHERMRSALGRASERLEIMRSRSPMAETATLVLGKCHEAWQLQRQETGAMSDSGYASLLHSQSPLAQHDVKLSPSQQTKNGYTEHQAEAPSFGLSQANDDASMLANFDLIGNMTDFNASFWTDQMNQILNANSLPEEDLSWAFLPA